VSRLEDVARAGHLPQAGRKFGRWMDLVLFLKHP